MLGSTFGRRAGCALASTAMFAGLVGVVSTASASAASGNSVQAVEQALAALHVGAPNHAVGPGVTGLNQVKSTNWSGYADDHSTGKTYATVKGSWKEPAITCHSSTDLEAAAFWVGIDGYSSSTVEQDGTIAICSSGAITYYSWWEMYPTNSIQFVSTAVAPGDAIAASVTRTGTSYLLKVTDSTHTAASFSTTQTCATCTNSSAEWIAERPSTSSGLVVLPDFHTWTVTKASVKSGTTTGTISTFPDDAITMIRSSSAPNVKLVTVGALNTAGNSFKATWHLPA